MTNPFPPPVVSDAAGKIALQAIGDAGLQHHESSGAKSTLVTDALDSVMAKAKAHRKVNSGVLDVARTVGPWYRRFDQR